MTAELTDTTSASTQNPASPTRAPRVGDRVTQARRERQLAGDERAGSWARGEARRAWWAFARTNWWLLARMIAAAALLIAALAWIAPDAFVRGLIIGAGAAGTIAALVLLTIQITGTGQLSSGATAEQWTSSELRPLRAHGWRVINHLAFADHDIDHVLVGPGGVIVVETKWSSHDWQNRSANTWREGVIRQAQGNARTLRLMLKPIAELDVQTAVFGWSAQRPDYNDAPDKAVMFGATPVIYGRAAAENWRRRLTTRRSSTNVLDKQQIDQIWHHLDKFVRVRDANIATHTPAPPTLTRLYWTVALVLVALVAGLLGNLHSLTATHSWAAWGIVTVAQVTFGGVASHYKPVRRVAHGWLIGVTIAAVLVAIGSVLTAV